MKRIKAWAVVSARGRLWAGYADALIFRTKKAAEMMASQFAGERVVPVVIEIEEEK